MTITTESGGRQNAFPNETRPYIDESASYEGYPQNAEKVNRRLGHHRRQGAEGGDARAGLRAEEGGDQEDDLGHRQGRVRHDRLLGVPRDDDGEDEREGQPRGDPEGLPALRRRRDGQDLVPEPEARREGARREHDGRGAPGDDRRGG